MSLCVLASASHMPRSLKQSLSRGFFFFESIAAVFIVPRTQWGPSALHEMKELTRRYEVDVTLLFYQFGSSMWLLGSVFPKDSYRRLDLQPVTQLIDDWIIRGFVHRWVCMNRTFRGGAPLKELDRWKPAYEGCLLSLVAGLFLDPVHPGSRAVSFFSLALSLCSCRRPRATEPAVGGWRLWHPPSPSKSESSLP